MELIKKIKEAEAQGQEIVKEGKLEADELHNRGRTSRNEAMEKAEQERKKAIEAAVAEAGSRGVEEIRQLKAQAEKDQVQLRDMAANKMPAVVSKVMDYVRG